MSLKIILFFLVIGLNSDIFANESWVFKEGRNIQTTQGTFLKLEFGDFCYLHLKTDAGVQEVFLCGKQIDRSGEKYRKKKIKVKWVAIEYYHPVLNLGPLQSKKVKSIEIKK